MKWIFIRKNISKIANYVQFQSLDFFSETKKKNEIKRILKNQ